MVMSNTIKTITPNLTYLTFLSAIGKGEKYYLYYNAVFVF